MKMFEKIFEGFLWESRLVVIFAVIACLVSSFAVFYMATVDAWYMLIHLLDYASPEITAEARGSLRSQTVTHVVEIIDGYLLATVLLIFALGLYELFISKIEYAEGSEASQNVLLITSLDDLKGRLAKVIMMILIVKFFEHAISMAFHNALELMELAAGIALLGLALYLSHKAEK
jgi:uncharacterized membrane protein YqhA